VTGSLPPLEAKKKLINPLSSYKFHVISTLQTFGRALVDVRRCATNRAARLVQTKQPQISNIGEVPDKIKNDHLTEMCCGTEAGLYLKLMDSCITQLKAQGPSRTCNESKKEEEKKKDLMRPDTSSCSSCPSRTSRSYLPIVVCGFRFWVWGLACRVQGSGFRVDGSGSRVQGFRLRVHG
jgi:hypothetical protein